MPSQQKHMCHTSTPFICGTSTIMYTSLPIHMYMGHGWEHVYIFFPEISLGVSQENKTKVQIKTKKKHSRNLFVLLFSKTHKKKNTNHPFFHTPPNTYKYINLNLKALVLKTSPNPKRRTFSRRQQKNGPIL